MQVFYTVLKAAGNRNFDQLHAFPITPLKRHKYTLALVMACKGIVVNQVNYFVFYGYIYIYTHAISLACALGCQCLGIVGLTRIPCLVTGVGSETLKVFTASLMVRKLQAQPATP